jgi:hypothetical protein
MQSKSPFYVVDELFSPLMCENIISKLNLTAPDEDIEHKPLPTLRHSSVLEIALLPFIEAELDNIEEYYSFETDGILPFNFEWYVEGFKTQPSRCVSFMHKRNDWVRVSDIGFTGVVFLNDFNDKPPFDPDFEVRGGKLEFLTHRFGFNPKRGTLIVYPEAPNFINAISPITAGSSTLLRFHVVPTKRYNYDMNNFPGDYRTWFK